MKRALAAGVMAMTAIALAGCSRSKSSEEAAPPKPHVPMTAGDAFGQMGWLLLLPIVVLLIIGIVIHTREDSWWGARWWYGSAAFLAVIALALWTAAIWMNVGR